MGVNGFRAHQDSLSSKITELIKKIKLRIMNIIEEIIKFLGKPKEETVGKAPDGLCELCWGYQQYDGKVRDLIKDRQVDINNHKDSYMLIENFVKENLEGIKLKEGEIKTCPSCGGDDDQQIT